MQAARCQSQWSLIQKSAKGSETLVMKRTDLKLNWFCFTATHINTKKGICANENFDQHSGYGFENIQNLAANLLKMKMFDFKLKILADSF